MDERLRFVARLLDGEKMAPLCGEFGIMLWRRCLASLASTLQDRRLRDRRLMLPLLHRLNRRTEGQRSLGRTLLFKCDLQATRN